MAFDALVLDFEGTLGLVAIDYADLRFALLPAFTRAMPSVGVSPTTFWTDFFSGAGALSPCTLLRRASMRLMTLADFRAGSSCGTGRFWILASTISRSAASYWSVNFSGANFAVLRLISSLASES